jgi:hypothetical protein
MSEQYPDLTPLSGYIFPVYVSSGCEEHGRAMAAVCQRAHQFLSHTLQAQADATVLVLAPAEWSQYATYPTYGLPHADSDRQVLIMPGEKNAFWQSMVPRCRPYRHRQRQRHVPCMGYPTGLLICRPSSI